MGGHYTSTQRSCFKLLPSNRNPWPTFATASTHIPYIKPPYAQVGYTTTQKMAALKPIAALIIVNMIFLTSVSSTYVPCPPKPTPSTPKPAPLKPAKCPKDTLKFGVCGDWLGLVHEVIGAKPSSKCCAVLEGLADLEAALCLCTAIKADVLGVLKFKVPVAISLVINSCGKKVPKGFSC